MIRRLLPVLAALAVLVAACAAPAAPALSDPNEVLAQGLEATANLKSFHMEFALDGTVADPTSGSTFSLSGTKVEGDFDLANKRASATFAAMGFDGEVRVLDGASYMKMAMLGPQWIKSDVPDEAEDPLAAAGDMSEAIAEMRTFLDREGVSSELLADDTCDERACYHVKMTLSSELLDEAASEAGESAMLPSQLFPDGLGVDLFFDKEKLYLSRASIDLTGSDIGDVSAVLTFTNIDEAVTVEAPPADEVSEGEGLPFP